MFFWDITEQIGSPASPVVVLTGTRGEYVDSSEFFLAIGGFSPCDTFAGVKKMGDKNVYLPTEHFSRKLEKVRQSDPPGYKRIQQVVERLIAVPDDADGKMQGLYRGRLKKYVGRRDYRVIYYWCKLCRKENQRLEKECDNCDTIPDNSVVFLDLYHKNETKKIKKNS